MTRNLELVEGEIYHIFNRGVDKRTIFQDKEDFDRFLECMLLFNDTEPLGSIYENQFKQKDRLGEIIPECIDTLLAQPRRVIENSKPLGVLQQETTKLT